MAKFAPGGGMFVGGITYVLLTGGIAYGPPVLAPGGSPAAGITPSAEELNTGCTCVLIDSGPCEAMIAIDRGCETGRMCALEEGAIAPGGSCDVSTLIADRAVVVELTGKGIELTGNGFIELTGKVIELAEKGFELTGNEFVLTGNVFELTGNGFELIGNGFELRGKGIELTGNGIELIGNGFVGTCSAACNASVSDRFPERRTSRSFESSITSTSFP